MIYAEHCFSIQLFRVHMPEHIYAGAGNKEASWTVHHKANTHTHTRLCASVWLDVYTLGGGKPDIVKTHVITRKTHTQERTFCDSGFLSSSGVIHVIFALYAQRLVFIAHSSENLHVLAEPIWMSPNIWELGSLAVTRAHSLIRMCLELVELQAGREAASIQLSTYGVKRSLYCYCG